MINPFVALQIGVFASIGAPQAPPPIAALICATLARRIANPPPGTSVLDSGWWSSAFNSIPLMNAAASVSGSIADPGPDSLASLSLGRGVAGDVMSARHALARWIHEINMQPTSLNCIAVTESGALISLSLAFLDVGAGTYVRTDATINAATAVNAKSLQSVFGAATELTNEPYFCDLQSTH